MRRPQPDTVAILIPIATNEIERARNFEYVTATLTDRHASWPWYQGSGACRESACWSKGSAVAEAREKTNADVLVIHDADVLVSPYAMWAAVDAVADGAPWAIPHREVRRLTDKATDRVLHGEMLNVDRPAVDYARAPYVGIQGGGITVVRADVWDDCPIDPRFTGWGGEDEAWGWALGCLYGPPWRGTAPLWHLWHPHPAPGARHSTTPAGHILWRAYRGKTRRPDLMRALVDQAR